MVVGGSFVADVSEAVVGVDPVEGALVASANDGCGAASFAAVPAAGGGEDWVASGVPGDELGLVASALLAGDASLVVTSAEM